jgi:poly-gamma-glutamate synthesis protein (capsule biosynthesis protein)
MNTLYNKLFSKKVILFPLLMLTVCALLISCNGKKVKEPVIVDNAVKNDSATEPGSKTGSDSFIDSKSGFGSDLSSDTGSGADSDKISGTENDSKEATSNQVFSLINPTGSTLEERIYPPTGFSRIASSADELTGFIRSLPLKKHGSPVLLYDGTAKGYQDGHVAVFDIDTGSRDLQQCADSVIRIYAEYFWSVGAYNKIAFHLTNGFLMEYSKWRDGNRLVVDGNKTSWSKKADYDDSYESFRKYLDIVFSYAGTISLSKECSPVSIDEILPGDMFIYAGSPGHCVLVVDVAIANDGSKCFLLAQGYMPAQDFHILINPLHPDDPWYYTSELKYPLQTPQWSFDEGSLVRWGSLSENEDGSSLTAADNSSSVKLLAVGDNLIHIQVIDSGRQPDGSYNYDHLYSNVKDIISAADIAVVNQETILGGGSLGYSGYPRFNSPYEIGTALINAGFDVILQATNHTMDKGLKGVQNNMAFWRQNYPDIPVLGINESKEAAEEITIIEKNGIKIAMLNYTYSLNGQALPGDMPYLVNMLDKKKMARDIAKAEELADFTIVFPHWGVEYSYTASKSQKELAEFYYDLGVDLVIGSHPHVLQPIEWMEKNADHKMLVYYSLGNFLSYQKEAPRMLGGIAEVTITKDESGTYISDAGITPIVTHYENGYKDYKYAIYKLSDYNSELAAAHGVKDLAQQGPFTYEDTLALAKQVLGSWYK